MSQSQELAVRGPCRGASPRGSTEVKLLEAHPPSEVSVTLCFTGPAGQGVEVRILRGLEALGCGARRDQSGCLPSLWLQRRRSSCADCVHTVSLCFPRGVVVSAGSVCPGGSGFIMGGKMCTAFTSSRAEFPGTQHSEDSSHQHPTSLHLIWRSETPHPS